MVGLAFYKSDMDLPDTDDYRAILLSGAPLLDVRAPVEFAQGAFPMAQNLPLLNDAEREQIGIEYKQHGQQAAIGLGHRLVSGALKAERVHAWRQFAQANPHGYLYCFRGGLRSKTVQQWLAKAGIIYPRIRGGYKAMRQFLLEELTRSAEALPFIVLGGRTGVAKTRFLRTVTASIDLEALANHRGSAFGREPTPQPSPINFENALSIALLRVREQPTPWVLLEDEGRNIGSLSIPPVLVRAMSQAPLIILEASLAERVQHILQDYIVDKLAAYQRLYGSDEGFEQFSQFLFASLARIQKRLGGVRYRDLHGLMQDALNVQRTCHGIAGHQAWIEYLLRDYYDPMYDYQLIKKQARIVFRGDQTALRSCFKNSFCFSTRMY